MSPADYDMPEAMCPTCGYIVDGALAAMGNRTEHPSPREGDYTICLNCAATNYYEYNLQLRQATGAEQLAMLQDNPGIGLVVKYITTRGRFFPQAPR